MGVLWPILDWCIDISFLALDKAAGGPSPAWNSLLGRSDHIRFTVSYAITPHDVGSQDNNLYSIDYMQVYVVLLVPLRVSPRVADLAIQAQEIHEKGRESHGCGLCTMTNARFRYTGAPFFISIRVCALSMLQFSNAKPLEKPHCQQKFPYLVRHRSLALIRQSRHKLLCCRLCSTKRE